MTPRQTPALPRVPDQFTLVPLVEKLPAIQVRLVDVPGGLLTPGVTNVGLQNVLNQARGSKLLDQNVRRRCPTVILSCRSSQNWHQARDCSL